METIAYIDARNEIANQWENGNSSTEAYQAARNEIRDYYAAQQRNHLQQFQKTMMQHRYTAETTLNDSSIDDGFLSPVPDGEVIVDNPDPNNNNFYSTSDIDVATGLSNHSTQLVNGSTSNYSTMNVELIAKTDANSVESTTKIVGYDPLSWEYNKSQKTYLSETVSASVDGHTYDITVRLKSPQVLTTQNVGDDLQSRTVWDAREWHEDWRQIQNQSEQATTAFSEDQVTGIYEGLNSGQISVSDLRTAEGQVRYMSGDADAQSGAYQLALYKNLGIQGPDLSNVSTMHVSYDGMTTMELVEQGGEMVPNYTDSVNKTYEGLLFASEPPSGGFEANQSYNTENLNGSVEMVPFDSEVVTFYKGNLTIENMTDPDGNELQTANWDDPEPDSYSSDDFKAYVDRASETREAIVASQTDDSGDGWAPSSVFGDSGGGVLLIGAAVVLALLALRDQSPV